MSNRNKSTMTTSGRCTRTVISSAHKSRTDLTSCTDRMTFCAHIPYKTRTAAMCPFLNSSRLRGQPGKAKVKPVVRSIAKTENSGKVKVKLVVRSTCKTVSGRSNAKTTKRFSFIMEQAQHTTTATIAYQLLTLSLCMCGQIKVANNGERSGLQGKWPR